MKAAAWILGLLLWAGCGNTPDLDGRWAGVSTTGKRGGFNYVLDLDLRNENVTGEGSVAIYNAPGLASDTTFHVSVQGTYRHPELTLIIAAPALQEQGGRAEFRGMRSSKGDKIEGVLSSTLTGQLPLVLEQQQKR